MPSVEMETSSPFGSATSNPFVDNETDVLLDEDEFIEVERIPLDELVDRICRGEVPDSKTQACVLRAKFEKLRRAGEV